MVELLMSEDWNKADAFLLPLTGLPRNDVMEMKSYLFWNDYSIENYQLTVTFSNENESILKDYCKNVVFPILDRNTYLMESYDIDGRWVFVLDISNWARDIEFFLKGKYSQFTQAARMLIERYHRIEGSARHMPVYLYAVLYPNKPLELLGNLTAIEYIADNYGFSLEELKEIGEVGSLYEMLPESLITNIDELIK
jgi:hypothetical protein